MHLAEFFSLFPAGEKELVIKISFCEQLQMERKKLGIKSETFILENAHVAPEVVPLDFCTVPRAYLL